MALNYSVYKSIILHTQKHKWRQMQMIANSLSVQSGVQKEEKEDIKENKL